MTARQARIAAAIAAESTRVMTEAGCTCRPRVDVELNDIGAVINLRADHQAHCHLDVEAATIRGLRCSCAFPVGDPRLN